MVVSRAVAIRSRTRTVGHLAAPLDGGEHAAADPGSPGGGGQRQAAAEAGRPDAAPRARPCRGPSRTVPRSCRCVPWRTIVDDIPLWWTPQSGALRPPPCKNHRVAATRRGPSPPPRARVGGTRETRRGSAFAAVSGPWARRRPRDRRAWHSSCPDALGCEVSILAPRAPAAHRPGHRAPASSPRADGPRHDPPGGPGGDPPGPPGPRPRRRRRPGRRGHGRGWPSLPGRRDVRSAESPCAPARSPGVAR